MDEVNEWVVYSEVKPNPAYEKALDEYYTLAKAHSDEVKRAMYGANNWLTLLTLGHEVEAAKEALWNTPKYLRQPLEYVQLELPYDPYALEYHCGS